MALKQPLNTKTDLLSRFLDALERGRTRRRRRARTQAAALESLDSRLLLTVMTTFDAGVLTVTSDASDVISIAANGSGEVTVNGDNDPAMTGPISASAVTAIQVTGGDGDNPIDLSGVTGTDFTSLTSVDIDGGSGADTITGSDFADTIDGGDDNDSISGGDGDDSIFGGLGDDTIAGNAGVDTIQGDTAGSIDDVTVMTNFGDIPIDLRPDAAPGTVDNFLNYINDGDYDNSFFHRLVPGFVLQGGGFTSPTATFTDTSQFSNVPTDPPIQNEFNLSNVRGTIAMAKLGNDPDSATSQWFFNLADNSANLDNQNGGFTVFAEVRDMTTVDAIAAFSTSNEGGAFTDLPLSGGELVQIQSIVVAGNDTIQWADGDGDDVVDGGGGFNDVQQVMTGTGDETLAVSDGMSGSFTASRSSGTPFSIDITGTEQFDLDAGDGADTVAVNSLSGVGDLSIVNVSGSDGTDDITVTPTPGLTTNVAGDNPGAGVGDTFTFNATGTVTVSDTVNRAGSVTDGTSTVNFSEFEDVQTADPRTLTVSNESITEGDSGTQTLSFTVNISNAQTQDITFNVDTADGTATTADGDYVAIVGQMVTIPAGQTSATATIDVTINGDLTGEANETFSVTVSGVNAEAGALTINNGTGTILSDDGVSVSVDGDGNLVIAEPDEDDSNSLTVTFDTDTDEFVVTSAISNLTDGMTSGLNEVRFAETSVTGGLLATLNAGDDLFDFSGVSLDGTVTGGAGNDTVLGGAGDDQISGDDDDDILHGGAGGDTVDGGAGNDNVLGNGGRDSVSGGDGDDNVRGHGGRDTLDGGAGIDRIDGGGSGNDLRDEVAGTAVITTSGYRTDRGDIAVANGSFGRVAVTGSAGDDRLDAAGFDAANVTLNGGDGNDTLVGGRFNDILLGGEGNDILRGGAGRDRLFGEAGDDRLKGQGSIDQLSGGAGDDVLNGGAGGTILREDTGGTIVLTTAEDGTSSLTGVGTDRLIGAFARAILVGDTTDDSIDVSGFRGLATLVGGAGNDTLTGTEFDDVISGGDGNDELIGLAGDDAIDGNAGDDSISGGQGIDTLLGGEGNDTLRGGALQDFLLGEEGDDDVDGEQLNDDQTGGGNGVAPSAGDVLTGRDSETNDELFFNIDRLLGGI
ncbi:MAG: peptidylprolyl isomerase [Planctomycetota bacterium]|jgi:cyclophilin family peptidyl-prolyl cis-trans isomerase